MMRLPYFVRKYFINPLVQTFVSSELLPGIFSSYKNEIMTSSFLISKFLNIFIFHFSEAITEGDDIMAGIDERDKILTKWMKEWDELGLDLVVTPASLMPAPLKVSFCRCISL